MIIPQKGLKLVLLITFLLLLIGCGVSKSPDSTPIPTLIPPPPAPTVIEVTFDGDECEYMGPSELLTGKYQFILHDNSGYDLGLWTVRLLEGKNLQDLFDRQSELRGVCSTTRLGNSSTEVLFL